MVYIELNVFLTMSAWCQLAVFLMPLHCYAAGMIRLVAFDKQQATYNDGLFHDENAAGMIRGIIS